MAGLWAALPFGAAACLAPQKRPEGADATAGAPIEARELMDVCWPEPGLSSARVSLRLTGRQGLVTDVGFEVSGGASLAIARCAREVAFRYPFRGELPDELVLAPPVTRPSGWKYLTYLGLLNDRAALRAGLSRPAPLVRSCLANGAGVRPAVRYRVQTSPLRITPFSEVERVASPGERRTEEEAPTTDSERCVVAVLGATAYPVDLDFELELSDLALAPAAAPLEEVGPYFAPDVPLAEGVVEAPAGTQAMRALRPKVAACWEEVLARRAAVEGTRTLRVRLAPGGRAELLQVVPNLGAEPEVADALLDRCLALAVAETRFTPSSGAPAELALSWTLTPRPVAPPAGERPAR